ncbi:MAG: hypothetical protein MRY32_03645 [Rickettsiales bacterium]|nr:hypothetical protein [Rickettsiales bacterium]
MDEKPTLRPREKEVAGRFKRQHISRPLERGESFVDLLRRGLVYDTGTTFDAAYSQARAGRPLNLGLKVGGVGLGTVIMADGIYNVLAGFDEEVEDMFIPNAMDRNHVRMFVGATELVAGAAALYCGLTKGPKAIKGIASKYDNIAEDISRLIP